MRIRTISISMDWKDTKNYNSDRYSIGLTADLESNDKLEEIEEQLTQECRRYLEKCSANGRNGHKIVPSVEKSERNEQNGNPQKVLSNAENIKPSLPDNRHRSVDELISKFNITTRYDIHDLFGRGVISYDELRTLNEHFCRVKTS